MPLDGDDIQDLLHDLEKRLHTRFTRDEFRNLNSLGDFHNHLSTKIHAAPSIDNPCPTARAFFRLQQRLEATGFPSDLAPSTPTAALFSTRPTKKEWRTFAARVDIPLPTLELPNWYWNIALLIVAAIFPMPIWLALRNEDSNFLWLLILTFPAAILFIGLLTKLLAPILSYRIPKHLDTLAGLAYHLALLEKESDPTPWTQPQLWAAIQYTFAQYTAINPRRIRRQTTFLALATMK